LDGFGLPVTACAWVNSQQADSWLFVLASPASDKFGLQVVYSTVYEELSHLDETDDSAPSDIVVQRDRDRFPQLLRGISERFPIAERWLTGYAIDGVSLEDMYVYRSCRSVHEYRGFTLAEEILPLHDLTYRLQLRVYAPMDQLQRRGVTLLASRKNDPSFVRTLGITDEAAAVAPRRLLDAAGPQPRVWAFLTQRGLDYAKRIIDLVLDRRIASVIPEREHLLTSEMEDFPFVAQDAGALLDAEFEVHSRV